MSYDLGFGRSDHFYRENFHNKYAHVIYQFNRDFNREYHGVCKNSINSSNTANNVEFVAKIDFSFKYFKPPSPIIPPPPKPPHPPPYPTSSTPKTIPETSPHR